jgi:uncharacterized protein YgbK (DUF1537 family)
VEHSHQFGGICIVADDLTGACDSGIAFLHNTRCVRVVLDASGGDPCVRCDDEVLVFTTESRDLPESEAAECVSGATAAARQAGAGTLLKKIDSAGRGNIGVETTAALNAWDAEIALVAPAFPPAGRIVDAGLLHIRDAAGQHAIVPLRSLFAAVEATKIGILHAGSTSEAQAQVEDAIAEGIQILLCDAATQDDLQHIASAGLGSSRRILWVGSAGLAHSIARSLPANPWEQVPPSCREGRTLIFVGTDHPVTKLQVSQLASAPEHRFYQISWDQVSEECIRKCFAEAPVSALVLTGGGTAAYVLRALQAQSIRLAGELSPGIPWGIIEGGRADGCLVITKSGGFGGRDALLSIIEFCNRRMCEPA